MPIDCEALHDGLIGQPVNAVTAFAFLVAAGAVYRRSKFLSFALAVLTAGSFSFHSDQNSVFGWLDGLGVLLVLWAVVEHRLDGERSPQVWAAVAAVVAVLAIPGLAGAAPVLLGGVIAATVVIRTTDPKWVAGIGILGAVAVGIYILGRNGAPLCDPDSLIQPHAIWHVLAAATVVLIGHAPKRTT